MNFVTTTLNFAWLVYMEKTLGIQIIVAPTVAIAQAYFESESQKK